MTDTASIHAEGWKTGFCQCDWCKSSRASVMRGIDWNEPFDLDQEEYQQNNEAWWNETYKTP